MQWEAVIGLEIHVQLNTNSKLFSDAPNQSSQEPNTQVSWVDLALPGTLPILNEAALDKAIALGLALKAKINSKTVFARKNYFYPDLPKGYQISQMEAPIVIGGCLPITVNDQEKIIRITRAHLEEDAGKLIHNHLSGLTGVDLNRAGVPLIEIVSEPDMQSAQEACAYAKKIHALVKWLNISLADMEAGNFRIDANVSVRQSKTKSLGVRREIKNVNSFRFLEAAIEYEIAWQIAQKEAGGNIQQTTVLFNPETGKTEAMREKENAQDYRYFPDPDLLPVYIDEKRIESVLKKMPEMPETMQRRFCETFQISTEEAKIFTADLLLAQYFEKVAKETKSVKLAANWIKGEVLAYWNRQNETAFNIPIPPEKLAQLILRISEGKLSHMLAKNIFQKMLSTDSDIDSIIQNEGLENLTDENTLAQMALEVIQKNPALVAQFLAGKEKVLNALMGQLIRLSKGQANPAQAQTILRSTLRKQHQAS